MSKYNEIPKSSEMLKNGYIVSVLAMECAKKLNRIKKDWEEETRSEFEKTVEE